MKMASSAIWNIGKFIELNKTWKRYSKRVLNLFKANAIPKNRQVDKLLGLIGVGTYTVY